MVPLLGSVGMLSLVFMAKTIQAFVNHVFLRYRGKELTTNMIIVDLKMLSGFSPDPDSLGRVSCCGVTFIHGGLASSVSLF